jgi:hypothetical protein
VIIPHLVKKNEENHFFIWAAHVKIKRFVYE